MNDHKVVIIVPVYNVETYLPLCLDSIMAQTFKDWACILVDDGSKDGSGKICDEYAKKDNRFSVIHKENGGVSSARNTGIEQAKGEWVFFSDADDTLETDALDTLLKGTAKNCQFVMAGFNRINEFGDQLERKQRHISKDISINEAILELYKPSCFSYEGYLWCKFFSLDIIKKQNIRFDENIFFNEDRLFILQYICKLSNSICFTTTPVYNYIERQTGTMYSIKRKYNKKYVTDFDAYVQMKNEVFAFTPDIELRKLALQGIVDSYKKNHSLMIEYNEYDSQVHWHMLKKMISSRAIKLYFNGIIYLIVLLLFPGFLAKRNI